MSSRYDDELWELVEPNAEPAAHLVRFVRSLGAADQALDLGCGDGRLTACLNAKTLVGADVSEVALARARERLPGARLVALEPDGELPFDDGSFELVLCAETIEHVRDVQLLLSEARRVLRPGGRLAIATPGHGRATALAVLVRGFEGVFDPFSPHLRFFSRRSLANVLDATGFRLVSMRHERGTLLAIASR